MPKRTPVSIVQRFPILPSAALLERRLVVVANAVQKKRFEAGRDDAGTLVMTARDIQQTGVFTFEISAVDWRPGWAMECEKPEVVVERVNRRLTTNGRRVTF